MKRWAFNLLAGASLALAVLTAVVWVRSYRHTASVAYRKPTFYFAASSVEGQMWLRWQKGELPDEDLGWRYWEEPPFTLRGVLGPPEWQFGPLEGWHWTRYRTLAVRHWSLVLLFSLAPAAWLLRGPLLRRRRARLGLCRQCGYDLRASPERCPECGRENAPSALAGDAE